MRIIFAPSIPWSQTPLETPPMHEPDPHLLGRGLKDLGISMEVVNPFRFPLNPFFGKDTLLQSLDIARALKILLFHRRADAVISVFEGAATSLGALRFLLPRRTTLAMWDIGLTSWRLRNKIIDFTLPRIDGLLVLGSNQGDYIRGKHAQCRRILTVGHLIDTNFFRPQHEQVESGILSVGDDIGRDFPTLIRATQGGFEPVTIKASRNPPRDLHEGCALITQRISYTELRALYAKAKVIAVPTLHTPNACGVSSLLEAAAMGKAAVVSDNPGIADFCIPGETCLMVPSGDVQALREALQELSGNAALRTRIGRQAREHAEQNFSGAAFAKRLQQALQELKAP